MINWSTDEESFKKNDPKGFEIWRQTQLINYGLDGEKLDSQYLKTNWRIIEERIDPYKARALKYLIWQKQYSLPNNLNFWNWQPVIHK